MTGLELFKVETRPRCQVVGGAGLRAGDGACRLRLFSDITHLTQRPLAAVDIAGRLAAFNPRVSRRGGGTGLDHQYGLRSVSCGCGCRATDGRACEPASQQPEQDS